MKSIIQTEKVCYFCGRNIPYGYYDGLEEHHIFYGYSSKNRDKSEKRGLKVWLCGETCHRNGKKSPHKDRETDERLKRMAQEIYERTYGDRAAFIAEFGKNYL